ncbi:MAG: hypothetical protein GY832_25060 [Chloroflexi bacterium]|nr:hypothetical protein [Chloroflexota bacterium]
MDAERIAELREWANQGYIDASHVIECLDAIEQLQATLDRPLDDDSNVLLARCDDREPLSLAEQKELFAWFEERGVTVSELEEQIEQLQAENADLKAKLTAMTRGSEGGK